MSLYEAMFLLDNRQANRDWDGSLDSVKAIVTKHGGEIVRCEKWGERRLAYEIDGRRRGTYVLMYFNADGEAVNRIYRENELSELVLRALILKVKALPPEEVPEEKPEPAVASEEKPKSTDDAPVAAEATDAPVAAVEPAVVEAEAETEAEAPPVEVKAEEVTPQEEVAADEEKKEEAAENA